MCSLKKEFMKAYDLDVCFVMDVTGSMGSTVSMVKRAILTFPETIERLMNEQGKRIDHLNVGVIAFQDHYAGDMRWLFTLPFTSDMKAVERFLDYEVSVGGGGGNPCEPLWDGVYLALHSTWIANPLNKACRRVIICFTDEDGCPLSKKATGIKNFDGNCAHESCSELPETFAYLIPELKQFIFYDGRLVIFGAQANTRSQEKIVTYLEYAKFLPIGEGGDIKKVYRELLDSFAKGGRKKSTADL